MRTLLTRASSLQLIPHWCLQVLSIFYKYSSHKSIACNTLLHHNTILRFSPFICNRKAFLMLWWFNLFFFFFASNIVHIFYQIKLDIVLYFMNFDFKWCDIEYIFNSRNMILLHIQDQLDKEKIKDPWLIKFNFRNCVPFYS